jgi:hypothetical protein
VRKHRKAVIYARYSDKLIYTKEFLTLAEAVAHEKYLKSGSGREMLNTTCDLPAGRQGVV